MSSISDNNQQEFLYLRGLHQKLQIKYDNKCIEIIQLKHEIENLKERLSFIEKALSASYQKKKSNF
jgi:hypothetical protein